MKTTPAAASTTAPASAAAIGALASRRTTLARPASRGRLHIVTFHRLPLSREPGELTLGEFEAIVDRLRRRHPIVGLSDGVQALHEGRLERDALALTFDDGYTDWVDGLVPALRQRDLPGTLFVCTDPLFGRPLWFDRLRALQPTCRLPQVAPLLRRHALDPAMAAATREQQVKRMPAAPRAELLQAWEALLGDQRPRPRPALDVGQLRDFHRLGMDIAGHTCSHPILAGCSDEQAWDEISRCRAELQALVPGLVVRAFAYPNGRRGADWGPREAAMVREAGFEVAVSTDRGAAVGGLDPMQLPRIALWRSEPLKLRLDLWRNAAMRGQGVAATDRPEAAAAAASAPTPAPAPATARQVVPARPQTLRLARAADAVERQARAGRWTESIEVAPQAPQVSVVIPAWNAQAWLGEAIDSVLAQRAEVELEIIVVNDGSTDGDYQRFARPPLVRVVDIPNGGVARARNVGIELARAPLLAFLDADDVWCPGKLAAQLQVLRERPALGLVFGAYRRWGPERDGRHLPWREALPQARVSPRVDPRCDGWLYGRLMQGLLLGTGGVVLRRELALRLGGFDRSLRSGEDHDFWLRCARRAPMAGLVDPVFLYRSNSQGLTAGLSADNPRQRVIESARLRHGLAAPHSSGTTGPLVDLEVGKSAYQHGWSHLWQGSPARARQALLQALRSGAHPGLRLRLYLALLSMPGALPLARRLKGHASAAG